LTSIGDDATAVFSLKLAENEEAMTAADARVDAATAALIKASANTTLDAPPLAGERKALANAQVTLKQLQTRHDMLVELKRQMAPKPPAPPPAAPEEQPQPSASQANILNIQPISPITGSTSNYPDMWPYNPGCLPFNGSWIPPSFIYVPPVVIIQQQPTKPTPPSRH
jgi:hypothetical protein